MKASTSSCRSKRRSRAVPSVRVSDPDWSVECAVSSSSSSGGGASVVVEAVSDCGLSPPALRALMA